MTRRSWLVATLAGLAGCGEPQRPMPVAMRCTPGATRPCPCAGGASGTQACSAGASGYEACNCPALDAGPTPDAAAPDVAPADAVDVTADATTDAADDATADAAPSDGCGCPQGFACGASGCELDPASRWSIVVTTGAVAMRSPAGGSWDISNGAPDPYACFNVGGERRCTRPATDVFAPTWNEALSGWTAAALRGGGQAEYLDQDLTTSDTICAAQGVAFPPDLFMGRTATVTCASGSFTYTLRAQ